MNKTQYLILIVLCFYTQTSYSQGFDKSISKVIDTISNKLNNKEKNEFQIAIYPFKYNKDNEDVLAEYVTEEFWDLMSKSAINYNVIDRATFDEYFKEHRLKSTGLIDPKTEKQFGMLIAADAYVTGKVYVFNSIIRLRVTVTDTQTGKIITTESGKLPITYDVASYIGLKDWKEKKVEAEKNKSSNPNCEKENVGDICFQNNSKYKYDIKIQNLRSPMSTLYRNISINSGKHACFRDLPSETYYYSITAKLNAYAGIKKGNIFIKTCQSSIIEVD
ncbi:CsgG/HfaB family protein [uncultured Algibacter sp.]|uniref:CsgG/HfaB family protein n=1 Tax=uncultured Algibacter sp. TaxID=298659 RepID=UPI0032162BE3